MRISPTQPRKKASVKRLIVTLAVVLASTYTHSQVVTNTSVGHVVYGKHGGYTCEPAGALCEVPHAPMAAYSGNDIGIVACCPTGWFPHWINNRQAVCRREPQSSAARDKGLGLRLTNDGGRWATHREPTPTQISKDWSSFTSSNVSEEKEETDWPKVVSAHLVLDSVQAKLPGNEHVKQCGQTKPGETCWEPSLRHISNHLYGTNKERCEREEGVPCEELQACVVQAGSTHSYADFERCRQWVPIGKPVFEDKTPPAEPLPVDDWDGVFERRTVPAENTLAKDASNLIANLSDRWIAADGGTLQSDSHGCYGLLMWDEKKSVCSTDITFRGPDMGEITCSPSSPVSDGPDFKAQKITCWYKPKAGKQ